MLPQEPETIQMVSVDSISLLCMYRTLLRSAGWRKYLERGEMKFELEKREEGEMNVMMVGMLRCEAPRPL